MSINSAARCEQPWRLRTCSSPFADNSARMAGSSRNAASQRRICPGFWATIILARAEKPLAIIPGCADQWNAAGKRFENPDGWDARKRLNIKRSEEHTSELQSLMRISYAVFCLKKKKKPKIIKEQRIQIQINKTKQTINIQRNST